MSQTMLYREGTAITCGPYSLDYIVVDDEDVKKTLADGWYKTPEDAAEAAKKERDAAAEAALQAQVEANEKALQQANDSGNGTKQAPRQRKPKKTANDNEGDLGANQTNADGTNPDAEGNGEAEQE